jgi:hypothetical protein
LRVEELRNYDVIAHHVFMLILSIIGVTVLSMHYTLYYFGVSELSSIPLVAYEQVKILNAFTSTAASSSSSSTTTTQGNVASMRLETVLGVVTALSFTVVRAIHFPIVTLHNFLPDCWKLVPSTTGMLSYIISFFMVGSIGFTLLQLYWFSGLVRTIFGGTE